MKEQTQICEPIKSAIEIFKSKGYLLESSILRDYHFNEYEIKLKSERRLPELEVSIPGIEQYDNQTYICKCHWSSIYLNKDVEQTTGIKMVLPIDYYELVIETDKNEKFLFNPNELGLYSEHKFLAYPDRLRNFEIAENSIKWKDGFELQMNKIRKTCKYLSRVEAMKKMITLSSENNAPTEKHPNHHVFSIHLKPYNSEQLICLSESIGGGHAEMGGGFYYSLETLRVTNNWKGHFKKSNCNWAIEIIESGDTEKCIVGKLVNMFLKIKNKER